jgi:hypothetical protein
MLSLDQLFFILFLRDNMTLRCFSIAAVLLITAQASRSSLAQEILFTNNAAYLDPTTSPTTPRASLQGYLTTVTKNAMTFQYVGVVLSNTYSTYNDIANPPAGAPGTTFKYGLNTPFGTLPTSKSWLVDMPLPVQKISTDPSNPTFITASFYLVDKTGTPFNNAPFSTYCFMTYISAGKVITSPAGGPYFVVVPPTGVGMNESDKKNDKTRMLPPPTDDTHLKGFWEARPSSFIFQA